MSFWIFLTFLFNLSKSSLLSKFAICKFPFPMVARVLLKITEFEVPSEILEILGLFREFAFSFFAISSVFCIFCGR